MDNEVRRKKAIESVDGLLGDIESSVKRGAAVFGSGELLTSLIPSFIGCGAGIDITPKTGQVYSGERRDLSKVLDCDEWSTIFYRLHALIEHGESHQIKAGDFIRLPIKVRTGRYGGLDFKELDIEETEAVVVAIFENKIVFQFEDVLFYSAINESRTNEGGFRNSALAVYLNGRFIEALFPIKDILAPNHDGLAITLPTHYEVFGNEDDEDGKEWGRGMNWGDPCQHEYFKKIKNRIRAKDNDISWWWLSSPYASGTTGFCGVDSGGDAGNVNASYTYGVSPCFAIC
jgi:hypothetical protein